MMDLSVIKEELSKLAVTDQSGDDMQKSFKNLVKAQFRPNAIFQNLGLSLQDDQPFDSIIMYQLQSSTKFEPILNPSQIGIFDASKSYYIILTQAGVSTADKTSALAREKHAIYLWIGEDQTLLNVPKALGKIQETEFRGLPIPEGLEVPRESKGSRKVVQVGPKTRRSVMPASINPLELQ